MARILVLVLVCAFVLVLLVTPCTAARSLRGDSGRSLSEENYKPLKRSSKWSNQESGDDAVPASASMADNARKYSEWARLLEEQMTTNDYSNDPAAASPSVPCCV